MRFGKILTLVPILLIAMANISFAVDKATPSDLQGVTQNWDKKLPAATRFTILADFGGAAVRDNNTGLVWEQAPGSTVRNQPLSAEYCANRNVGGTVGWRLPSVIELRSVQDPSLAPPLVPTTVFTGVQAALYWTATSLSELPTTHAWVVTFNGVGQSLASAKQGLTSDFLAWCVRGPTQESIY